MIAARSTRVVMYAVALAPALVGTARAESCALPRAPDVEAAIARLAQDARPLLAAYAGGGGALASEVRNVVSRDSSAVGRILDLVPSATPAQRVALGTGLGAAATICLRSNATVARQLQQAVLLASSDDVRRGFESVVGDIRTEAIGPAAHATSNAPITVLDSGPSITVFRSREPERPGPVVTAPFTTTLFSTGLIGAVGPQRGSQNRDPLRFSPVSAFRP